MNTVTWMLLLVVALLMGGVVGWLLAAARSGRVDQGAMAVAALVDPMQRSLERVEAEVRAAGQARMREQAVLGEHLRGMTETAVGIRKETADLVTALRSSQTRGAWGELQLRRVVEAAGMVEHVDFVEQASVTTADGRLRPDMVVKLAGGRSIVVDAKVAFVGYLEAQQATDPRTRAERMDAHVRHVRQHVKDLASKKYWDQFAPSPEFVVMFLPAESFLAAALDEDPALLEDAARMRVMLATPVTLLAMLRTIAYAWRQDALATNAQDVLDAGKELYSRLTTMMGHLGRMGGALDKATEHFNALVGSLDRSVLVSARRMAALGVVEPGRDIPTPDHLDCTARHVEAATRAA